MRWILPMLSLLACADEPDDSAARQADPGTLGGEDCELELVAESADITCDGYTLTGATVWVDCAGRWWAEADGVSLAADDCVVAWVP